MSSDALELTIEESASSTDAEFTGDVWELTVETGPPGPAGPPGSGGTTDHGALTGLTDPDHPSTAITVPDDTLPMFDPDTIYAEVYAACITAGASTGTAGAIATVAASYVSDQPDTVHAALINASKLLGPTLANSAIAGILATAAIPKSLVDAKGDLIAGTAGDTPDRLAVGSDGKVLTADSAEPTGLKWGDAPVPTTRTITAGTGLTGGGSLASDRTLAVTYGLTENTAAEGISIVHAHWRTGSYYGPSAPRTINAGQTLASGAVRAMPFYNPVSGRTIDQLAVDVQSGSAGTGVLYVMLDDGTGYPGTVVASGTISSPTTSTRSTTSVSYTLPRGLLWIVAHGTGTTWSGLTLDGQSPHLPAAASYSTSGTTCWYATGAGTSTLTAFPAGASLSTGVLVLMRAA